MLPNLNAHYVVPTILQFVRAESVAVLDIVRQGHRLLIESAGHPGNRDEWVWAEVTLL